MTDNEKSIEMPRDRGEMSRVNRDVAASRAIKTWAYAKKYAAQTAADARARLGAPQDAVARESEDTWAVWIGEPAEPTCDPVFPPSLSDEKTWAMVDKARLRARAPHGIAGEPNWHRLALDFLGVGDETPVQVGETHVAVWLHPCDAEGEPVWP
jgi:hypothetical protein